MRWAPALVVAVFALYAQTARHAFVDYDTNLYLTGNAHVQAGLTFDGLRWAAASFAAGNWHPLTWLSHMLDVELFGLHPAGHHLENAAWHAANAVLVLALFERLGLARPFAFAGALLFAIHPLRAESVAWIAERKDLLCAFFGLSSLLAWLAGSRAAALALYACSLMSKPMLVTLPCLLLLLGSWPARRKPSLATLAFFVLAVAACLVALRAQSSAGAVQTLGHLPFALRVENALDSYLWYIGKTLWPAGLAFHYPLVPREPSAVRMLVPAAALVLLTFAAWCARAREPGVLVGWLWFLGTLVPVIGLVQVGAQAHADRYTYLPGIGLLLSACLLAERELAPRIGARALLVLASLVAAALAWGGWVQIGTWRSTESLALHALAVTQKNSVACNVLGSFYSNSGRTEEGLPLLREAVRIAPGDPDAVWNLASTLLATRQHAEAEQVLLRASEVMPQNAEVWALLARLYNEGERYPEALAALERAVALDPLQFAAWQSRASVLADEAWILALATEGPLAQPRLALELAERALRTGGAQPVELDAFAFAAAANGDFARAVPAAEAALRALRDVDPDWAARLQRRLAAYREQRIDRETPR